MGARGRASSSDAFFLRGAPFLLLLAAGSWGLSHFLKLPVQLRDDAKKRKREGRHKFSLNQEHERLQASLLDENENYENVRVPGARDPNRVAAD